MRAIVMTQHGGPEVLETRELPDPAPGAGEVLVRVRAFGLNHADIYMRSGVWSFGIPVLRDSLQCVAPRGRACQIGFLGGLDPVVDFNPLADLPSGVALSTFASAFVLGGDGFPITDMPLQTIVEKAERGVFSARPSQVFAFDEIVEAHRVMDSGEAGGKVVVTVEGPAAS